MQDTDLVSLSADIVSAYVSNNRVQTSEISALLANVHEALRTAGTGATAKEPEKPEPAVNPKKSVTPDHIISLFDGRKFKSMRRYLQISHNMTPEDYRRYWGLPHDYPIVAPNYAKQRSELAKSLGLGSMRKGKPKGSVGKPNGKGRARKAQPAP
jgi:predicted transcriptional regulator